MKRILFNPFHGIWNDKMINFAFVARIFVDSFSTFMDFNCSSSAKRTKNQIFEICRMKSPPLCGALLL